MLDPDYALFVQVVDAGSLSAAGRALRLSPAMVSKRIARLEARLDVRLLHRTTRRVAMTAAGEGLYADLQPVLAAIEAAERRVTGARAAPSGSLRVTAPTSFGRLHVVPHLPRFLDQYPQVTLDIDLTDAFVDLIAARIDVAIRIAVTVPPGLTARRLGANRRILCASPAYCDRHGTPATLRDLLSHRLLAADGQWPWRLVHGRRSEDVDGVSHVRTNSSEVVRDLAIGGVGIALRSLWDVDAALASGALVRVLPDWEGSDDLAIWAVHPHGAAAPAAVTALLTFLAEVVMTD